MRFSVLGSGSKGNCTLVESGSTRLLIDNGFSGKELLRRLSCVGVSAESLSGLVITHEHGDHVKGVGVVARKLGLPVYANPLTYQAAEKELGRLPERREFATGQQFTLGELSVHPFAVSHDTADPVGFIFDDGMSRLGYCTDTGKITQLIRYHLQGCQALILEANHDIEMLRQGPYPLPLQQRVLSSRGHLNNVDALQLAADLASNQLRFLVLAHLSEINNKPELVLSEVRQRLAACPALHIMVARQSEPGPLTEIVP